MKKKILKPQINYTIETKSMETLSSNYKPTAPNPESFNNLRARTIIDVLRYENKSKNISINRQFLRPINKNKLNKRTNTFKNYENSEFTSIHD